MLIGDFGLLREPGRSSRDQERLVGQHQHTIPRTATNSNHGQYLDAYDAEYHPNKISRPRGTFILEEMPPVCHPHERKAGDSKAVNQEEQGRSSLVRRLRQLL